MITPLQSIIKFSIITLLFFIFKYMLSETYDIVKKGEGKLMGRCITVLYLVIIIFMQISDNIQNSTERCGGSPQIWKAITYTIGPNLLIFGGIMTLLTVFPGWNAPFSNTIGYGLINLVTNIVSGGAKTVGDALSDILIPKGKDKLLNRVYRNPEMMINEITPSNFNLFLAKMGGNNSILKSDVTEDEKGVLYNFVVMKDNIAKFIWYILTGILVIQNSSAYIMSIKCERSETELEESLKKQISKDMKINNKKEEKERGWLMSGK